MLVTRVHGVYCIILGIVRHIRVLSFWMVVLILWSQLYVQCFVVNFDSV